MNQVHRYRQFSMQLEIELFFVHGLFYKLPVNYDGF